MTDDGSAQFPTVPARTSMPGWYQQLLDSIAQRISLGRLSATTAVNRELTATNWAIGKLILDRQDEEGWGSSVIDRLSSDLKDAFPGSQGFSPRNLRYMRTFAEAWPDYPILQRVAELPWRHQIALGEKLTDRDTRLWYAATALAEGWSRDVLVHRIETRLHLRVTVSGLPALLGTAVTGLALSSGASTLAELRPEIQIYEEIRVWMAKFDAADRQATGEPVPEEVQRLLGELIASATASGDVLDIYEAAGMPKPSLDDLSPEFIAKTQQARNPHLAIEALRKLLTEESARATSSHLVRQRAFSERINELMNKYTNQQLTSAEVIAELVTLAREVAAEANRGSHFAPPLNHDELAFYDAVAQNDSAVELQGEGVLAEIARELVAVMRRDVRTDWTVRAKLRSSIKRLLVKYGYPPDRQPVAIKLVMEQMESMAPRYSEERVA